MILEPVLSVMKTRHDARGGETVAENSVWSGSPRERIRFYALLAFLFLCLVGGGASRSDALSLLYLRPAAILLIALIAIIPGTWSSGHCRPLFILLALFSATMLIQLVPLPPMLWTLLPGHARFAEAAVVAGMPQPWHPISLTPDLTLNSLLALLLPFAALLGFTAIRPDQRAALLPILLIGIGASAIIGIAQLSGGRSSVLYLYRITHNGSAVGFLANRNHEAALLALAFPMLRLWTLGPARDRHYTRMRFWIAVAIGCCLVPALLVTGSRAGVALGLVGLIAALTLAPPRSGSHRPRTGRRAFTILILIAGVAALGVAAVVLGRAEAFDRLLMLPHSFGEDVRFENFAMTLRIAGDFLPFGSGFGSFDPIFRVYEADWMLKPTYYNHAHNDAIELVLTGGVAAALVLGGFLIWALRRATAAFRPYASHSSTKLFARLGAVMILILFLASLVDYPLRTPLLAVIFTLACAWLAQMQVRSDNGSQ